MNKQEKTVLKLAKIIEKAIFLERPNRFVAIVEINGEKKAIHVPNPGRMKELLIPGKEVILRKANNTNRKTEYDLLGIIENGVHISLDSNAPNKIFKEAILLKPRRKISAKDLFGIAGEEKVELEAS